MTAEDIEFCWPHQTSVEQLVNKNERSMTRLPGYPAMIREHRINPRLSAHITEVIA